MSKNNVNFLTGFTKLFSRKPKQEFQIVADVGTTSVKMVAVEKRGQGFFLSNKTQFEIPETRETVNAQEKIQQYMREHIFSIIKERGRIPQKLHIGISGDMLDSRIETIHIARKNQQKKLTETELQELIQDAVAQFSKRDGNTTLAYFSVANMALDGYAVKELPRAAYPATVTISFFLSFAPQDYWTALTGITAMFGGLPVQFYPNQYLAGTVLPKQLGVPDAVFIDVGGMITEVAVVNDQKLSYAATIHYGGEHITGHLANLLHISSGREAKNFKKQYDHLMVGGENTRVIEEGVRESARAWREKLDVIFSSVYTVTIPSDFFLFGGGVNFTPILEALGDKSRGTYTASHEIIVKKISAEDLHLHYIPGSERLYGPDAVGLGALIMNAYGE